ncbi:MAG: protein-L-isoaspartate(D-aspartate) O-methyltransferase [Candidatus Kerfeldbacteria bacterium]|nr:protein-L-isoaspartate(D-aspartate) O-methyltransferase [Candidatus Kerfeldbacteria bacterium]
MGSFKNNDELVDYLVNSGVLKSKFLVRAWRQVSRADFVPAKLRPQAYADEPLPIGLGQTISQPSTVAFMLELLRPEPGQRVLEIGAGSGYVAALLAQVVGERGEVIALERIAPLVQQAKKNTERYHFSWLELLHADGGLGYSDGGEFDRILVSAAAVALPPELSPQLGLNGRLVAPVGEYPQDIILRERTSEGFKEQHYPGFVFVPLLSGKVAGE